MAKRTMTPGEENARGLALSKAVGLAQGTNNVDPDEIVKGAEKFLDFLYPKENRANAED